jgi:pantoate kinase
LQLVRATISRAVYVPSAVSSFFEICDTNSDGSRIEDVLKIGSRGGGFVLKRGSITRAKSIRGDTIKINSRGTTQARTTQRVIDLMRSKYGFGAVEIYHRIEPPIGFGFGTSGSGALGAAIAISDLFKLNLSLSQLSAVAHAAEVESVTGLGTVISLASGAGAIGLVTEPGSFAVGRVDSILVDLAKYVMVCACFGPIEKSSVLRDADRRLKVNEFGKDTLEAIMRDPTPSNLLSRSRLFAEKTGIASKELLTLSDWAVKHGAIGATQNMIGNAIHCLVERSKSKRFAKSFGQAMKDGSIFVSDLVHSGPTFV